MVFLDDDDDDDDEDGIANDEATGRQSNAAKIMNTTEIRRKEVMCRGGCVGVEREKAMVSYLGGVVLFLHLLGLAVLRVPTGRFGQLF